MILRMQEILISGKSELVNTMAWDFISIAQDEEVLLVSKIQSQKVLTSEVECQAALILGT